MGGGLFDYSVYSWSLFNQEPDRLDQEGTKTSSPPSQDKDQDQELDNIHKVVNSNYAMYIVDHG